MEEYFHVSSKNYHFLTKVDPKNCEGIFVSDADTPSSLLKKNMIHIFSGGMNPISIM